MLLNLHIHNREGLKNTYDLKHKLRVRILDKMPRIILYLLNEIIGIFAPSKKCAKWHGDMRN